VNEILFSDNFSFSSTSQTPLSCRAPQCPRFRHLMTASTTIRFRVRQSRERRVRPTRMRSDQSALTGFSVVELPLGYHHQSWRRLKEFWYNGARNGAGCPFFPKITKIGGHNSQKRGTGPGNYSGFSTGIIEVIFSRIWRAKVRTSWGSDRLDFFREPDLRSGSKRQRFNERIRQKSCPGSINQRESGSAPHIPKRGFPLPVSDGYISDLCQH
jgi:hypothetical protein